MGAAKVKKAKKAAKVKNAKARRPAIQRTAAKRAKAKPAAQSAPRQFRFTAAATVKIHFAGEKRPETFRVDDMSEASLITLDGQTKLYFQYRLISNDKTGEGGAERCFWFFDAKPVGAADSFDPSLWRVVSEAAVDGHDVVLAHSGHFSARSVTSYDGSGSRHVVKVDGKPAYRMRLDLNGKREFGENVPVTVGRNDVLSASAA
jgi:hypothetical protein